MYFNKFIHPYTWSIAKTWLNILVDNLEEHHNFEKTKDKKFIDVVIIITIYNAFIYLFFKIKNLNPPSNI